MPPVAAPQLSRVRPPQRSLRRGLAMGAGAVVVLLLAVAPATGALYKWTDASGRIVYSDQPPPGNVKVEQLNVPPPADPNAVKDLATKEVELQKKKQARAEDETKANTARVEANMRRQECDRARGQAITLAQSSQIVIYTTNAKGERTTMDDAARLAERQRLDYWINKNCQNLPPTNPPN